MPMTKEKIVKKFNKLKIPLTILLVLIFIQNFGGGLTINPEIKVKQIAELEKTEEVRLTPENLYQMIIDYKFEHPKVVFSQVMWETGNLTKVKNNNLFGFRGTKYLKFDSWEDCIIYAKNWQDKKYVTGNYYDFLKRVKFAEDSLYINKIKKMEHVIFKGNKYGLE